MPHEAVNSVAIFDIGVVPPKWLKTGANSASQPRRNNTTTMLPEKNVRTDEDFAGGHLDLTFMRSALDDLPELSLKRDLSWLLSCLQVELRLVGLFPKI